VDTQKGIGWVLFPSSPFFALPPPAAVKDTTEIKMIQTSAKIRWNNHNVLFV
jgi:hypothetical protein